MHPSCGKLANQIFSLRKLGCSGSYVGCGDILFREITTKAEMADPYTLFVALSGSDHEAGRYLKLAEQNQACGVVTNTPLPDLNIPQHITANVRRCYGLLCQAMFANPAQSLKIIGVTGTNGKTTISWMLRAIFQAQGLQTGLLGTIEYDDGLLKPEPARLTTPDAATLAQWMSRMLQVETRWLAMEISSHSLDQCRIAGIELEAAIISNITRDHLDYHGSFENYQQAKLQIAAYRKNPAPLIVNCDDLQLMRAVQEAGISTNVVRVGCQTTADFRVEWHQQSRTKNADHSVEVSGPGLQLTLAIPLVGQHNLMNAAQAGVAAHLLGCSEAAIVSGLRFLQPPPGRMQPIELGQPFSCYVDYAHTPDAIDKAISAVRERTAGKIICVLGAGGNRDQAKRPEMGRAASQADITVLTADNSRSEPTAEIIAQLAAGVLPNTKVHCQPDREEAIAFAIELAVAGDCVLILGKGHEKSQQIGDKMLIFDDVASAEKSIKQTKSAHYATQINSLKSA